MITQTQFEKIIEKVAKHNEYPLNACRTVKECDKIGERGSWTPIDLICREYYNNGCGSSMGFLGITPQECEECFDYIREHQEELKKEDRYNKDGYNNFGFPLWHDYILD